jgi:hypothetical protein
VTRAKHVSPLALFQEAAVSHIVERFRDKNGSRRFLLADEVGLGKTFVARGVIAEMAQRRKALKVMYLCSNSEIATQNRPKLVDNPGKLIGRVTELILRRDDVGTTLYAFTPGTSIKRGTGLAWERTLLLFLLNRCARLDTNHRKWREFFRCGAGHDSWSRDSRLRVLRKRFNGKISTAAQNAFRKALSVQQFDNKSLLHAVLEAVERFDSEDVTSRRQRNLLVAELRHALQRVATRTIHADLVVLDEVQRFRDVLKQANEQDSIASEILVSGRPTLILSATPYRAYTPEHEVETFGQHHQDFFDTIEFLFDRDVQTPRRIRRNLNEFGTRLRGLDLVSPRDDSLLSLKRTIEKDLKLVLCRTERNWYLLDVRHHTSDSAHSDGLPSQPELEEFFALHRALRKHSPSTAMTTAFWKSAPSMLSFMDAGYSAIHSIRNSREKIPRRLLAPPNDRSLVSRNRRMRRLVEEALGPANALPQLWVQPIYKYYNDGRMREQPNRKILVFSGWRFVPKAISVILSRHVLDRVGVRSDNKRQPLRLLERDSFHVFDVCYPSPVLADLVNPRANDGSGHERLQTIPSLVSATRKTLRSKLAAVDVIVADTRSAPLWKAVARLEASARSRNLALRLIGNWRPDPGDNSDGVAHHRRIFSKWFDETEGSISINRDDLSRLATIALFSPAISLMRSLQSVYRFEEIFEDAPSIMHLCFGALRRYFNRPMTQATVRKYRSAAPRSNRHRGFARRTLEYAADFHLQSTLDEYCYLLRHAGACVTVEKMLSSYRDVWSLGSATRRTNGGSGKTKLVSFDLDAHKSPTHFALAFGEEEKATDFESNDEDVRVRRSLVREAFNSPFWPFVLATTSVGQEGLDFHWYCRDVFHWNLPSNPVDLEQREGRVNRRDSLAVRASIGHDRPYDDFSGLNDQRTTNPWTSVFDHLEAEDNPQRYKHGLYPHWIYECNKPSETVGITRHVSFHDRSRDKQKYERLKLSLALYRLVFGQANQDDLLADLRQRLEALDESSQQAARRKLAGYMLNLSPVGATTARHIAEQEAERVLRCVDRSEIDRLLHDVDRMCMSREADMEDMLDHIKTLTARVQECLRTGDRVSEKMRLAMAALVYLRNPYDEFFDHTGPGGFDDDRSLIRQALLI